MNPITKLKARRDFREALEIILETDSGKVFFKQFLKDSNVSRPTFHKDPYDSAFHEGRRHLAMSYLNLLGREDPQHLINIIESEQP